MDVGYQSTTCESRGRAWSGYSIEGRLHLANVIRIFSSSQARVVIMSTHLIVLTNMFIASSSEYNVNDGVGGVCRSSLISALWHKSYANGAVLKK